MMRQVGAPSAAAASRSVFGTRRSMFSVEFTTTGIKITATPARRPTPKMSGALNDQGVDEKAMMTDGPTA